jgi:FkbM family methyltransferase
MLGSVIFLFIHDERVPLFTSSFRNTMTAKQWLLGKYYAVRALATMVAWFDNWSEIFNDYRNRRELPGLRFRRGITLHHRPEDQALLQFYDVFRDKSYWRYSTDPEYGTVVDIGANIGIVALDYLTRFRGVRVHAYEPHPATFQMLWRNLEANHLASRVRCFREAVGRSTGETILKGGRLSMEATVCAKLASNHLEGQYRVPIVSFNTVIRRCMADPPVILAKIDAEGAEADILEAADAAVLRQVTRFVIEYHEALCFDARARCIAALSAAGFTAVTRPATQGQGLIYAWRSGTNTITRRRSMAITFNRDARTARS